MGLNGIKPWFVGQLRPIEDKLVLRRVSPDTLTYAAVGMSAVGAATVAAGSHLEIPFLWSLMAICCFVRLVLNALDGSIARRTNSARPFGRALNEIGDRAGDALMLGSLAVVASPALAAWSLAAAFATSIVDLLAESISGRRTLSGPMGKADRVAVIATSSLLAGVLGSETPFEIALWVVLAGSLATATLRIAALARETSDAVR